MAFQKATKKQAKLRLVLCGTLSHDQWQIYGPEVDEGVVIGTATGYHREVGTGRALRRPASLIFFCHRVRAWFRYRPGDAAILHRLARFRIRAGERHEPVLERRTSDALLAGRDRHVLEVDEGVAVGTATGYHREVGTGRTLRRPASLIFLGRRVRAGLRHCPGDAAARQRLARLRSGPASVMSQSLIAAPSVFCLQAVIAIL